MSNMNSHQSCIWKKVKTCLLFYQWENIAAVLLVANITKKTNITYYEKKKFRKIHLFILYYLYLEILEIIIGFKDLLLPLWGELLTSQLTQGVALD